MGNLSVCLITLNEEQHLAKALQSIEKLADEIVLVDSGSTDKTIEIAKKFQAKIFERKFDNYATQKNFALSKATSKWVLFLDGDEIIEKSLAIEIKEAISEDKYAAYSMPRKNIIFGKFIRYTRWQPELDRHVWLFKKDKGHWAGKVHEDVVVNGAIGKLKSAKVHYQYESVSQFLNMMDKYSTLEASQNIEKGIKFSIFKLFYIPLYNFLVRYTYRLGFLDGMHGFVLSLLMAIYHFEVLVKTWEHQKK